MTCFPNSFVHKANLDFLLFALQNFEHLSQKEENCFWVTSAHDHLLEPKSLFHTSYTQYIQQQQMCNQDVIHSSLALIGDVSPANVCSSQKTQKGCNFGAKRQAPTKLTNCYKIKQIGPRAKTNNNITNMHKNSLLNCPKQT